MATSLGQSLAVQGEPLEQPDTAAARVNADAWKNLRSFTFSLLEFCCFVTANNWSAYIALSLKRVIPHAGHDDALIGRSRAAQTFEGFSLAV